MANPRNYKEFSAYISKQQASENCVNRELFHTIKELMYTLEIAQIQYDRKESKILRRLFTPEINFEIVDELCFHIHNVLAYLNKDYDKDLNQLGHDDFLWHINRIKEIREEHFKGENWNILTVVLKAIAITTFVSSIITLCITLPLLIPCGLLVLSMISMAGGMYFEKQGFNYSVASKLRFFEPENLSFERDSNFIEPTPC